MTRCPHDLLYQVVALINQAALDYPRGFKAVLHCLIQNLSLRDAAVRLLGSSPDTLVETISAAGPDGFEPLSPQLDLSLESETLARLTPVIRRQQLGLPLFNARQRYGVLVLEFYPDQTLDDATLDLLQAVSCELASLTQLLLGSRGEKRQGLDLDQLRAISADNARKYHEISLLYRISRAMHSTLRLNEVMHLILSAATVPGGGGFGRAMLFTINERTETLQGMLGVTPDTATLVLPRIEGRIEWDLPQLNQEVCRTQAQAPFSRQVLKQRLPLDPYDNALSRAVRDGRVLLVKNPAAEPPSGVALAAELGLTAYACAPLLGRQRPLGVLVVDDPDGGETLTLERLRFLELFANQGGAAMENSMLLHRLETAHQDLRETQERLIQGEKMAVLGEMAASVAHELKNPLVSIGGFAQRLNRIAPDQSREQEYAAIIAREVQRMEEMLSNILAFSKKQMLCLAPCRLSDIIREALDMEVDNLMNSAIGLVVEMDENLPAFQGDEQKLRQVIINLITNARQVMVGGGTLTVRTSRTVLRGESALQVEVEDTGGGIPPQVMRNIFNPFFTTKDLGTGLGLSISHRIIDHHNGEIEVLNRKDGAVFILRLPVQGAQPSRRPPFR